MMLFLGLLVKEGNVNGEGFAPFRDLIPRGKCPKAASMELAKQLWDWAEDFGVKTGDGIESEDGQDVNLSTGYHGSNRQGRY